MEICFSDRDIKGASTLVDGNGERKASMQVVNSVKLKGGDLR
jgi:hypothetical protein